MEELHVLFIDIWMTVSDFNTNPTVIILVGIEYHLVTVSTIIPLIISWDLKLNEMHILFIGIWMTVSDYNTNLTVIILVGIGIFITKCLFHLLVSG